MKKMRGGEEKKRKRSEEGEAEEEKSLRRGCIGRRYMGYGGSCRMEMIRSYLIVYMYEIHKNTETSFF